MPPRRPPNLKSIQFHILLSDSAATNRNRAVAAVSVPSSFGCLLFFVCSSLCSCCPASQREREAIKRVPTRRQAQAHACPWQRQSSSFSFAGASSVDFVGRPCPRFGHHRDARCQQQTTDDRSSVTLAAPTVFFCATPHKGRARSCVAGLFLQSRHPHPKAAPGSRNRLWVHV